MREILTSAVVPKVSGGAARGSANLDTELTPTPNTKGYKTRLETSAVGIERRLRLVEHPVL
jgi:hypothetical protein